MEFIAALFIDAKFFLCKSLSAVFKTSLIMHDQAQQTQNEKLFSLSNISATTNYI